MEIGLVSSRRRRNSGRKLCFCGLEANITQAWTDKNPGRRFYGCPRYKELNGCKFFSWFDEEDVRDEIREETRVIEQLKETIAELRSNLENTIVRKFEEFFV
ncbi:hypothetical protein Bca52824_035545 [Brassica carinata]|uniref:GRF-type domain-containing protein n=1 Tax=Brassica carinata TaxID=52824 RepID=A0A8X7S4F5_BRACI|nr:hypothetical protein Bca52824_035545 [Brassica carinata]